MRQRSVVAESVIAALRKSVQGAVIDVASADYAAACSQWNAAIDRRPPAVVACTDAEDVAIALRVAADCGVKVTIRGGGHNIAGKSIREDAVVIDMSALRSVTVNPATRMAVVQGGARWYDVDAATSKYALATTGGVVSSTGVGGLTLGGGAGWLMRRHGLAVDNLVRAHVILADGRTVWASADEHEDLFWGLRGGCGELGAVSSFEFALHPLHQVLAGLVLYPAERARSVLAAFRDFAVQAPDEFCGMAVLSNAPPLPFIDPACHGRPVVTLALCWSGDLESGMSALQPLRNLAAPWADIVRPVPYAMWQQMQDPGAPPGRHQYWKNANFSAVPDSVLDVLSEAAQALPSPESQIHLQHMGGAVARRPAEDTAFAHRQVQFFVNVLGVASFEPDYQGVRLNVLRLHERLAVTALPGLLPNFTSADDNDSDRQFGNEHAARLCALRRLYDPRNAFGG